jgi:hippurate hydrolase
VNLIRSKGYPNLQNDALLTNQLQGLFSGVFGDKNVKDLDLRMTAEDFAFYAEKVPSCFYRLGVGNKERGIIHTVHHPNFDIDPNSLEVGVLAMSLIPFFYES